MASSSFSNPAVKYDVYLSFRGEDTRDNFVSHLYAALLRRQIVTFRDDALGRGDEILSSFLNAIEESKISVIIFSKGYASSRWCLEELVKILESKDKYGQIVIPVFYRIDSSDVRKQTGTFGVAFAELEERIKESQNMLQRWRTALREAAIRPGFVSNNIRSEAVLVEKIADDISKELNDISAPEIHNRQVKYDVWLSFKGEDTSNNFTSCLRAALYRAKIETFIDNEDDELTGQDKTSLCLSNPIEESRISIIIFSEGYASSKRCMEEFVQILECKKKYGQAVIPIFYKYGATDALKNPEYLNQMPETLKKWSIALREATDLDGFNSNSFRCESDLVEVIVKRILKILNLVGVQSNIKEIGSLLDTRSKDVRTVGIWGMCGIGKTTITKELFDEIKIQFEGSYFALNVSEESKSLERLTRLRQELFSAILKDGPSALGYNFTKQRLGGYKRVLIVLDDVTSFEQITFLIGDLNRLGLGSRIIITSNDRQVLKKYGVDDDKIYKVDALFDHEALQLFSRYAFQQNHPPSNYNVLSKRVVEYTKGVPLALKVLGSFLREKTKSEWKSAINNLEGKPFKDIQMVLAVSYEGLDDYEKNIFLDIACFLNWECTDFVIKFLNVSGFFAESGISVLIDRCLITISNNRISMNALLQEMGWKIVREENSRDLGKRSRLWYHADIYDVLKNNVGTEAIEGICLDMSKITHIDLNPRAFAEMSNLRFLKIYNSHCEESSINKLCATEDLEYIFSELSYLCWHGCPLKSLQSVFCFGNLVALDMFDSDIQQLWTGEQVLFNLKSINLSYSKHLQESPNFSLTPNLESLILEGCTSLLEISSSINCLDKLVILNLRQCKSLHSLPTSSQSFLEKLFFLLAQILRSFQRYHVV